MTTSAYHERAANGLADAALECIWTHSGSTAAAGHLVIPDNCADILLELEPDGSVADASVVGVMTRPVHVAARPVHLVGLRFRPGWLAPLLRVDAAVVRDARVPLSSVAPSWARALESDHPLARLLDEVGTSVAAHRGPTPVVRAVLDEVRTNPTELRVESVCRAQGVSRQFLARVFNQQVGIGPKFVARVSRLARVRGAMSSRRGDWARLAAESGFADQSHLVREMRALAGAVPTALL